LARSRRPPPGQTPVAAWAWRLRYIVPAIVALLIVGRIVFHYAAEITVKGAFYDGLGMGDAYSTRWHTNVILALVGIGLAAVLVVPILLLLRGIGGPRIHIPDAPPQEAPGGLGWEDLPPLAETFDLADERRAKGERFAVIGASAGAFAIIGAALAGNLVAARDTLLLWRNGVDVGATDPVFGQDLGFFFFTEPAWSRLLGIALTGLILALLALLGTAGGLWFLDSKRNSRTTGIGPLIRATSPALILGGLIMLSLGGIMWLSRYGMTIGGDELVAGAGNAERAIDIPTRTVGAGLIGAMGLGLLALSVPAVRRRAVALPAVQVIRGALIVWGLVVVALVVFASPWWLVLLVPVGIGLAVVRRAPATVTAIRETPIWAFPAAAVASAILMSMLGPLGAALNDAVVLRGSKLQVERPNIEATLDATRRASGIDDAVEQTAAYRPNGVTRAAIAAAPASVGSLRFLDIPPTQSACSRLQTFNQFYSCEDIDIGRGVYDGRARTVFSAGREIDYGRLGDFQRRHFTFTHGYGFIAAPVDEIAPQTGRPVWIAGDIPQRGVELAQPQIYFGAQQTMPWAMVNTDQPVFDEKVNRVVKWSGGTGVKVGSGWRRLALTEYLGGLPYLGGGRRVWNATSGDPADANSEALLFRDIGARMTEIAPFLTLDGDPYFATADGRLYVMAAMYASTDRFPYAVAGSDGTRYARQSAMAVMDAYSGETKVYVLDETEPITRAWRSVYPTIFTPASEMSEALRSQLRYGEALFDFQSSAVERFHVNNTDTFFNGDEAWAPTQEAYGPGVDGQRIVSPARYTYAVLPGETKERFLGIRSFKPRTEGRGIGFSGWLAVSNEPDDFGKLTVLRFPSNNDQALDSLDTFTASVSRDPELSQEIQTRRDNVLRGNTIVVPIGRGLLYVQPLYLDDASDSLPSLWQVVVSFGDGTVHVAPSFAAALTLALDASGDTTPAAPPPPGAAPPPPATRETLQDLVRRAASEFEAYQRAFGRGDDEEALKRLRAFRDALSKAEALAGGSSTP
jgi:uncharacterized protein